MQIGEGVRVNIRFQGRFMHQAANCIMSHHQAIEFLLNQVGRCPASTIFPYDDN